MSDIDSREDFEQAFQTMSLPLPDMDMSLAEYAKTLCSLLGNPVKSLHQMFVLFVDFKTILTSMLINQSINSMNSILME